jgi:hypothetical protein
MSSASGRESDTKALRDLRFTHWPLRDETARSLAILLSGLLLAVAAGWLHGSAWTGGLAAAAIVGCLWRLWLPVHFEFGVRGVTMSAGGRSRRVAWRDVAVCEFRRRGVVLYPSHDTSMLASLRATFVGYPPQRQQFRELLELALARQSIRATSSMETVLSGSEAEREPSGSVPSSHV